MNDSDKGFTRPKVRFSKSAECPEKFHSDGPFGKIKIRSVTNLQPPVKILKNLSASDDFKPSSSPDEISSRHSAGDAPNDSGLCPRKTCSISAPCIREIILSPESQSSTKEFPAHVTNASKSATCLDGSLKTTKNILIDGKSSSLNNVPASLLKGSKKSVSSHSRELSNSRDKEKILGQKFKTISKTKTSGSGKENIPSKESKENVIFKVPENTPRTTSNSGTKSTESQNRQAKNRETSSKSTTTKNPVKGVAKNTIESKKIVRTKPEIGAAKKIGKTEIERIAEAKNKLKAKSASSIGLMPCAKSGKSGSKNIPMKKTILRDASAGPSKVYVGPGLPRTRSVEFGTRSKNEIIPISGSETQSAEKFARPEYNSIICTIKQLRAARENKIVEDLEHLPAIYRRLINGKVSSALDFGANEAIYHDLVDLSIDEKQLPSRITRSKDPEPRQRDVSPKLSDFFVPSNDEEFRRAVLVRPPSPRVLDTWNPYKISDRIFSWKESLDHDL